MDPMDASHFLHHRHQQNRYVPVPHPHPHPHPPRFSDERSFHHHHNIHLPPPLPLPLQPHPYHNNPRFSFPNSHPIEDRRRNFFDADIPPRVSDRFIFDRQNHHPQFNEEHLYIRGPESINKSYPDGHSDVWNAPSRVPPDNRAARPFPVGWDHEPYHPSFEHSTSPYRRAPPSDANFTDRIFGEVDRYSEGSRFSNDGLERNRGKGMIWNRIDYQGRDFASTQREIPGSYLSFGSTGEALSLHPSIDQKPLVFHHSETDMENGEIISDNGSRVVCGKRYPHKVKKGKYKNVVGRESSEEFVCTPKRTPQKTSALLRLQKPAPRKTKDEQLVSSAYFDESNSGSFRGKGPMVFSDHGQQNDREGSPVELDVSFKSNALVAKAIMVPSSPVLSFNRTYTPKKNMRKLVLHKSGSSSSQVTEFPEGPTNGDSKHHADDKNSVELEEKVTVPGIGTEIMRKVVLHKLGSSSSQVTEFPEGPINGDSKNHADDKNSVKLEEKVTVSGIIIPPDNVAVEHPENMVSKIGGINVNSVKINKPRFRRKRKVTNPLSDMATHNRNVVTNAEKHILSSEEKVMVFGASVEKATVKGSPIDVVSAKDGVKNGSKGTCTPKNRKKKKAAPKSCPVLSKSETSKILEIPVKAEKPIHSGDIASSSVVVLMHPEKEVENYSNSVALLPKKRSMEGSPKNMVSGQIGTCVGSDGTFDLKISASSSSKVPKTHNLPVNADSSTRGAKYALKSDKGLMHSEESVMVSGNRSVDDVILQPGPTGVAHITENDAMGEISKAMVSVRGGLNVSSGLICKPNIKKIRKAMNPLLDNTDYSTHTVGTESENKIVFTGKGKAGYIDPQHCINQNIKPPDERSSEALFPLNESISKDITQLERENVTSRSFAQSCLNQLTSLLDNCEVERSADGILSVNDSLNQESRKLKQKNADSKLFVKDSAISYAHSSCVPALGDKQQDDGTEVVNAPNCLVYPPRDDIIGMESGSRREQETEVDGSKVRDTLGGENCKGVAALCSSTQEKMDGVTLKLQSSSLDQRSECMAMEIDGCDLLERNGLPSVSSYISSSADALTVPPNKSNEELDTLHNRLSKIKSPESLLRLPEVQFLNAHHSLSHVADEKVSEEVNELDENPILGGSPLFTADKSFALDPNVNVKADQTMKYGHSIPEKTVPLLSQETKKMIPSLKPKGKGVDGSKLLQSSVVPRVFPGRFSFVSGSVSGKGSGSGSVSGSGSGSLKGAAYSTHIGKPRTWRRTDNPSASPLPGKKSSSSTNSSQKQSPKKFGKVQSSSYVRKGNSLVRKCSPVVPLPKPSRGSSNLLWNLDGGNKTKNTSGSENISINPPNSSRIGVNNTSIERPKTPPLPHSTKLPNCCTKSSWDCTSSPLAVPLSEGALETTLDPVKLAESEESKHVGASENGVGVSNDSEIQNISNSEKSKPTKLKKITYVKNKINQLVAATSPELFDPSIQDAEKTQAIHPSIFSDNYYKRNKNQLIRNAVLSGHVNQAAPDDSSNSEGQRASKISSVKCCSNVNKRRSNKVFEKTQKHSNFSLVWTPRGTKSQNVDINSLHRQKVLPYLFPWKRTYSRNFMYNTASVTRRSSSSLMRKLLLSRKREAVYTRSTRGFSLRRSKVLSIGGSHLKWSKSIERRSKKVNEEATRAVVAAEMKKKEQKGATFAAVSAKTRNQSSRERIFRIGSVRYKMDSSKRTLQRIPDDSSPCTVNLQSGKAIQKSFVPRRLLIGNNEYVRIGNGSQLIRDPKKLIRILASEKIRWSLHTARLRLARKQQYCQFFTRFGKCNKGDGKCPYIHDPAKIAVCTKFLRGLCSNTNCNLTHKVIPERMQDCSYFLKGLCTNQNCPYRHVNVNPNASVCGGFLRGYCEDGDECRKKHSYVCPSFEATGICPQGSKCKLHHPNNKNRGKKRKRSKDQKEKRKGRYFGSRVNSIAKLTRASSDKKTSLPTEDVFFRNETFADFVSLDVSDEEEDGGETDDVADSSTSMSESDPSDLPPDDLDELIKPFRIMK